MTDYLFSREQMEKDTLKAQSDLAKANAKLCTYTKLYMAINEMLAKLGYEGEITATDDKVCDVMDVLYEIDGGVYNNQP